MEIKLRDLETKLEYTLQNKPKLIIGRDKGDDIDITLPDRKYRNDLIDKKALTISKYHCTILMESGKISLVNEVNGKESKNGTFVNNEPVHSKVDLKDGDDIKLGDYQLKILIKDGLSDDKGDKGDKGVSEELNNGGLKIV